MPIKCYHAFSGPDVKSRSAKCDFVFKKGERLKSLGREVYLEETLGEFSSRSPCRQPSHRDRVCGRHCRFHVRICNRKSILRL